MLVRTILPAALGELSSAARSALEGAAGADAMADGAGVEQGQSFGDGGAGGDGGVGGDGGDEPTVVFVARYSVKNFFLAHFDLLQVVSILLHARGAQFSHGIHPRPGYSRWGTGGGGEHSFHDDRFGSGFTLKQASEP